MSYQQRDRTPEDGKKALQTLALAEVVNYEDLTDQGGAYGTYDLSETLPHGAMVLRCKAVVVEAFDGTSPDVTVGVSGDVDRFNSGEVGVGSTGAVDMGEPSGQRQIDGETTVQVRIGEDSDFGNLSTGAVAVEVHYSN